METKENFTQIENGAQDIWVIFSINCFKLFVVKETKKKKQDSLLKNDVNTTLFTTTIAIICQVKVRVMIGQCIPGVSVPPRCLSAWPPVSWPRSL